MDGKIPLKNASYSVICSSGKELPKEVQKCENAEDACRIAHRWKTLFPDNDYVAVLRIDGALTKIYWRDVIGRCGTDLLPNDSDFPVVEKHLNTI